MAGQTELELQPLNEEWLNAAMAAMRLKRLNYTLAKLEIVLGLAAAAAGLKLLQGDAALSLAGGALAVLGGYLALAGSRSHLYLAQNRQTAYVLQAILNRRKGAESDG